MANRLTNVDLLLMLAQDQTADNQDWSREVWKEGEARVKKIQDQIETLDKAKNLLVNELKRLSVYLPEQEQMPRAVTQGPRNEPIQRKANQ